MPQVFASLYEGILWFVISCVKEDVLGFSIGEFCLFGDDFDRLGGNAQAPSIWEEAEPADGFIWGWKNIWVV